MSSLVVQLALALLGAALIAGCQGVPAPAPGTLPAPPAAASDEEPRRDWQGLHVQHGLGAAAEKGRQAFHFVIANRPLPEAIESGWRWREQLDGDYSLQEQTNRFHVGVLLEQAGAEPTKRQLDALGRLAGWLVQQHGLDAANAFAPPAPYSGPPAPWTAAVAHPWHYIVIHHSATVSGNAATFHQWHKDKGWGGLGYHFVIGNGSGSPDGALEVGYRWRGQLRGAHAKNPRFNEYGIGICLVGNFEEHDPSAAQIAATRALVARLRARYGIGADQVYGHREVREGPTACPGRRLALASILAEEEEAGDPATNHATGQEEAHGMARR